MISDLCVKDRTRPSTARYAQRGVRVHRWTPAETRGPGVSFRYTGNHRVRRRFVRLATVLTETRPLDIGWQLVQVRRYS